MDEDRHPLKPTSLRERFAYMVGQDQLEARERCRANTWDQVHKSRTAIDRSRALLSRMAGRSETGSPHR